MLRVREEERTRLSNRPVCIFFHQCIVLRGKWVRVGVLTSRPVTVHLSSFTGPRQNFQSTVSVERRGNDGGSYVYTSNLGFVGKRGTSPKLLPPVRTPWLSRFPRTRDSRDTSSGKVRTDRTEVRDTFSLSLRRKKKSGNDKSQRH